MIDILPNWHPVFVHFTVALWSLAAFFYLSLPLIKAPVLHAEWKVLARWNLWLGAAFAVVTATLGLLAFNSVTHDAPSHAAMSEHRNWALAALLLFLALTGWSVWHHRRKITTTPMTFLVTLALAVALLMTAAWHGAEVVYRYGIGVKSLPKAEAPAASGEGMTHDHGDAHEAMMPSSGPENLHGH